MRELVAPLIKALKDEWYPEPPDGQPRKVKVSGAGIALLGVVMLMVQVYYLHSDVGEVKQQVGLIWQVMVTGKVPAQPAKAATVPSVIGSATADELPGAAKSQSHSGDVGGDLRSVLPVGPALDVDRVGEVAKER